MARITIKAEREYLRQIFSKIDNGDFAVPIFQRDFVWNRTQIKELFDSIIKGYPIGSLVLWKSKDIKKAKNILTDNIVESPEPEYYILDGRQRMTTFYGCVSSLSEKDDRFKLTYNLDTETFDYKMPGGHILLVSDIYDTFLLLGRLEELRKEIKDDNRLKKYINRAKMLNSLLQEYTINEILMSECSLEEATTVFNRINSEGTKISDFDILQATTYSGDKDIVLHDRIREIQKELGQYGFETVSETDILRGCLMVVGKDYFDARILELKKNNFEDLLPDVKRSYLATARFLHDDCSVISQRILPYQKQFMELACFFLKYPVADGNQKQELIRWFFYTTICQSFQNSSMANIRTIHNRMSRFISGDSHSAFDYSPVRLPELTTKTVKATALSKMLSIIQIYNYRQHYISFKDITYLGSYRLIGNSILGVFPKLRVSDSQELYKLKHGNTNDAQIAALYGLDGDMLIALQTGSEDLFVQQRIIFIESKIREIAGKLSLTIE